jgi:hypothetical protein
LVIEMVPGMTLEKLQTLTEPKLHLAPDWRVLAPPEAPRGPRRLALQLLFPRVSESIGNHDSKIVDAGSVD